MKKYDLFVVTVFVALLSVVSFGQTAKRTVTKTDRFDFGSGGTIVITGAPTGSIKVVGAAKNEIEIMAEIELQAANDADLAKLAEVTGFITDESAIRTSVISLGVHNKFGLKKLPKNFPKQLLGLPFSINYTISVPKYSDLEIDGGIGELSISGVEGTIRANFIESNAKVDVVAGSTVVIIGKGSADVTFGTRGWRGRYADISVGNGDLNVSLPSNMSAEIDATVLRDGSIENLIPGLKPRDRKVVFTEKLIVAKAGVGGSPMKFTVGAGKMRLARLGQPM